jgi:tetratricopeptide (TPR) repeat protein
MTNPAASAVKRTLPVFLCIFVVAFAFGQAKKTSIPSDVKAYQEALGYFKKAEAMIGTAKENSDEQADLFRKVIQVVPDFIEAHFNLGLIFSTQKKPKEAAQEFEAVRKINPGFEGIYQLLAQTYRELGQNEDAIAALQDGIQRQPRSLPMLRALTFLQLQGSDDQAAIPTLKAILELDSRDADALMNLGIVYQKHNRLDESIQSYRAALALDPTSFNARFNIALVFLRQNKLADAAMELLIADKLSPGNPEVLERLGDIYAFQDHHDRAADAYQGATAKASDRAVLFSKLAFSLAKVKRVPEAVAALEKSVSLDSRSADAYYLLGDLYSELQRYEESIAAYNKSIKIDPKQKDVRYNLGTLYAELKLYENARAELKAAVDLDPEYAAAWSNLAVVCEKLELDKDAIQANEKVIAAGQAQAATFFRLGILYAKNNLPDPAITSFARAIQLEPDKYRQILREELKKVRSVLDSVRYKEAFVKLLTGSPAIIKS